jgi:uncharacterized membrane protein YgcG
VCGFTLSRLTLKLGVQPVVLERVIDAAQSLAVKDRTELETMIDDFERRLPQVLVSYYIGQLPQGVSAGDAALWLCEYGVRKKQGIIIRGRYAVVVVLNPVTHTLAISLGLGLAEWVGQAMLERWMAQMQHHYWHGEYVRGLRDLLDKLGTELRARAKPRRRMFLSKVRNKMGLDGVKRMQTGAVEQEVKR